MQNQLAFLIFELKGIIDTMEEIAGIDDQWGHPCIDRLQSKINELVALIQPKEC
ncbi:hypothetical protein [Parageobacillus thermoglucosidasius]|jgi:hypothetical protein|uniref:hypothetical protein n=1 Tax=Parageobacillus thermoglucosidasius TaxID=1426 RepID=UPI0001D17A63|nr:hypothetical protein [Parageobacillus thermoglucosidasius]AEH47128.1 hypothetical protein Geoth_1133 [Parageobacillus thermoglucosidasius C56-YS93]